MNTIVMKLGKIDLQNLIKTLAGKQVTNNNPYVTFAAKVNGVTVLAYTSGKVVFKEMLHKKSLANLVIKRQKTRRVLRLVKPCL